MLLHSLMLQVYTFTPMSGDVNHSSDSKDCICVKSFTHYHEATSPAFDIKDYNSKEYSTWAESKYVITLVLVILVCRSIPISVFGKLIWCTQSDSYWHCTVLSLAQMVQLIMIILSLTALTLC